ncbi:hypothetical protein DYE50_04600 [Treponema ruminis]|uniref:YidC/Oxa1 family membrane protein insertase n=1 Tax=Treponema ruminis TaxID=744515 RepID=A0A7W8G7S4_9SPIR|nr:YidC/Oxa1 family membrane protein insertase [Treponema ruminis]MBB5225276.1 YidC/Oxa1 family membrane protein insertase [Treponema ruminis]QSI01853.1 hypothetical protein DYE50_04600 [Treponema ruminis]
MANFLYTIIIYPLIQVIEFSFSLFNSVFKEEGISVIGVSIAVSVLCLPLYIVAEGWQQVQRDTEKRLDKGIKRIKETFKGDEQYMILSAFYKENHYHPLMALRSSFGLLIQVPFFMAAYSFLSNLPVLRGYSFGFIRDMGAEDALFSIGSFKVNVLPIAMTLINIIAGAIYTKGFKFKDKLTIYGMALVFLVILYNSPSGLVLYWTMNNVFSLVKNVFYKIKNPKKVLYFILAAAVLFVDYYALFHHHGMLHKRLILVFAASILLLTPLAVKFMTYLLDTVFSPLTEHKKTRFSIFLTSSLALAFFAGFVLPSLVINSSPVEFANIDTYGNPLYFLYNSTVQMLGLLVFWPICIYFLFNKRVQTAMALFFSSILFACLVDAFCFAGDYGTLSRLITFDSLVTSVTLPYALLNTVSVIAALLLPLILLKFKKQKILQTALSIILIASLGITVVNSVSINSEYSAYKKEIASKITEEESISPVYHLSKNGKNVVLIMSDRAEGAYFEPIFEEFPELKESFSGFTYFKNTISFNQGTLLGAPALYGGYEYTPYEINQRSKEKLVDKQNEALLLLPRIFTEQADFNATVTDLSWANYSWIPDMSITNQYPKIKGFNVERKYTSLWVKENPDKVKANITSESIKRNLVWYSLFKFVPCFMRDSVYDDGAWWSSDENTSDVMEFLDFYTALAYLPRLTDFTGSGNQYFTIVNDTTHSTQDLQAPDYEPAITITDTGPIPYSSISGNIAMFKKVASWIDYLKANDCYDNTRIIIVADHGIGKDAQKEKYFTGDWEDDYNPDHNWPLLMYKDFGASGQPVTNEDFMTNADVPSLLLEGLVEKPKNPFTGKEIKKIPSSEKKASGVVITHNFLPGMNGLYTFSVPDSDWYTVTNNIFDSKNWQKGVK